MSLDEFTTRRYKELSGNFVDIYEDGNPLLAAKMLVEQNIPDTELPVLRELIHKEFLHRGWTFPTGMEVVEV